MEKYSTHERQMFNWTLFWKVTFREVLLPLLRIEKMALFAPQRRILGRSTFRSLENDFSFLPEWHTVYVDEHGRDRGRHLDAGCLATSFSPLSPDKGAKHTWRGSYLHILDRPHSVRETGSASNSAVVAEMRPCKLDTLVWSIFSSSASQCFQYTDTI